MDEMKLLCERNPSLTVALGPREEDVVHGHHGHVLFRRRVAAVRQRCVDGEQWELNETCIIHAESVNVIILQLSRHSLPNFQRN